MPSNSYRVARLHSIFYRDNYYKMLRILTVFIAIMLLLIIAIVYLVLTPAPPHFYATTPTGQIISMTPIH